MLRFTLNGTQIEIEDGENRTLLEYLRNVKCMKGTKEACSTGHCGACSVLVDGRLTRSCVTLVRRLDGKTVETIENAPNDTMLQVIQHSFLDVGAVQCGFCIPGMVMSAKGLLDMNPNPTREEAAYAIRNNICRCTGYVKIIDGILLAAELFRKGEVPPVPTDWSLGARVPRVDVEEKVTGTGIYPDDIYLDGMIYGSAVRSQYPRARVLAIHTEEARAPTTEFPFSKFDKLLH